MADRPPHEAKLVPAPAADAVRGACRGARIEAARETGRDRERFLGQCPYSFADIAGREFSV